MYLDDCGQCVYEGRMETDFDDRWPFYADFIDTKDQLRKCALLEIYTIIINESTHYFRVFERPKQFQVSHGVDRDTFDQLSTTYGLSVTFFIPNNNITI
jgi:hypothetical protein